jgi:hypothetical protein
LTLGIIQKRLGLIKHHPVFDKIPTHWNFESDCHVHKPSGDGELPWELENLIPDVKGMGPSLEMFFGRWLFAFHTFFNVES